MRRHAGGHYFRRSRQNGWLGTRVRESQMTCACVRLTTSTEVVHRKHRDRKGSELATTGNPKGEPISENQKSQSEQPQPFCRNPESKSRDQSSSETDEHSCRFRPNEWKPHPPSQDREREREKEKEREGPEKSRRQIGTGYPLHRLTRTTRFAPSSRHSEPKDGEEASH